MWCLPARRTLLFLRGSGPVFHCPGKTKIFNGSRPNQNDLEDAKKFAKEMVKLAQ
ncbi:MAG: hypothetical protein A4E28_00047 [Methanocella sp. PtaU1.Bin125]|nr:MAG: hypothetical protein A4E28_00047 [Methanocella sp. PtaU1.Bin125]